MVTIDKLVDKILAEPATTGDQAFNLSYTDMPTATGIDIYASGGGRLAPAAAKTKFQNDVAAYNGTIKSQPTAAAGVTTAAAAYPQTHTMLAWLLTQVPYTHDVEERARKDLASRPGAVDAAFEALWEDPAKRDFIYSDLATPAVPAGTTKAQARVHYMTNMVNSTYRESIASASAQDLAEARRSQGHFKKIPQAILLGLGLLLGGTYLTAQNADAAKKILKYGVGGAAIAGAGCAAAYGLRRRY